MDFDCLVVGAGPAGLSAALTLGRARRRVLVLDSGKPRNYAARAMHGVLGHDGLAPAELRARGVEEVGRYCDGWEHADQRIAVPAGGAAAEHMGPLLRQWSGDVIVFSPDVEGDIGVPVVPEPISRFVSEDGQLTAIELVGRDPIERDTLFFHVAMEPRSALARTLGCALNDTGFIVAAAEDRQTSVDRVYAAGNCADPMQNVAMAIADGARAGVMVNVRLVGEGVVQPSLAR